MDWAGSRVSELTKVTMKSCNDNRRASMSSADRRLMDWVKRRRRFGSDEWRARGSSASCRAPLGDSRFVASRCSKCRLAVMHIERLAMNVVVEANHHDAGVAIGRCS